MRKKTGYKDSVRQELNMKLVFFCPWDTESRCFSGRLTTATSEENYELDLGKHESGGLNARKHLLHNFHTSSICLKNI